MRAEAQFEHQTSTSTARRVAMPRTSWLLGMWVSLVAIASPLTAAADDAVAFYYAEPLSAAELQGKTLRELAIIRNTIFARAGAPFHKKWLHEYFAAQPWYTAKKEADRSLLTETDWQNAKLVAEREANITPDELSVIRAAIQTRQTSNESTPEDALELRLIGARLGTPVEGAPVLDESERSPLEDLSMLDKQLTREQLSDLSRRDLRILRNTVYARRGYTFKSPLLGAYFADMAWYQADPEYTKSRLTKVDWRNVKLIKSIEEERGGAMKDREQEDEEGWFMAA